MTRQQLKNKLNPNWITGFIDGEGCFTISITKNDKYKTGWHIQPFFKIKLHKRDEPLIRKIKEFFNEEGSISIDNRFVYYSISNLKNIQELIIPHFIKYPLITQKQSDFILWKNIIKLINNDKHLHKDGLIEILNIRASLNKGLSSRLKLDFPMVSSVYRPIVNLPLNINPDWFAGFFSGEGCFYIDIKKGKWINLRIIVGQHKRDLLLMNNLVNILNCGTIKNSGDTTIFSVNNIQDIHQKFIPLFKKYPIEGAKFLDFVDFCVVADLVYNKLHFTSEGINKILNIKSRMNLSRYK